MIIGAKKLNRKMTKMKTKIILACESIKKYKQMSQFGNETKLCKLDTIKMGGYNLKKRNRNYRIFDLFFFPTTNRSSQLIVFYLIIYCSHFS